MFLFKILKDGKPCSGGVGEYPPVGIWTTKENPQCCSTGWHLTAKPLRWFKKGCQIWLAEGKGEMSGDGSDKAAFESVRLVEEITWDWKYLPMFPEIRLMLAINSGEWSRANLSRADLSRADLSGADLSRADLSRADLSRADLSGADLSGANLSRANLSRADLSGADLFGANLSRANLFGANLFGANPPSIIPDGWKTNDSGLLIKA